MALFSHVFLQCVWSLMFVLLRRKWVSGRPSRHPATVIYGTLALSNMGDSNNTAACVFRFKFSSDNPKARYDLELIIIISHTLH